MSALPNAISDFMSPLQPNGSGIPFQAGQAVEMLRDRAPGESLSLFVLVCMLIDNSKGQAVQCPDSQSRTRSQRQSCKARAQSRWLHQHSSASGPRRLIHEQRRSAGVSPASSASVPLDDDSDGETPPELAAEDGCATPRRFMVPMRSQQDGVGLSTNVLACSAARSRG